MDRVDVGDLIKFSKEHVNRPGHEYVDDWLGIVVETKTVGQHCPIDEMRVMWRCCGTTQIFRITMRHGGTNWATSRLR